MGWLKTVDQYATGGNNTIQHANTGLTIDTVLSNLLDNPDRTFSYVEQAFFQRWVQDASQDQLDAMQRVVASGQMTFINGAWAMHDEVRCARLLRCLPPRPPQTQHHNSKHTHRPRPLTWT